MTVTFTKEDLFGSLDQERHQLLLALAALDLADAYEADKYLRPLIAKRLLEIKEERKRRGLEESDTAEYADAEEAYHAEVAAQRASDDERRV
jgi:hypothetical protein